MIALAVLTAGLAGSCTKNIEERLDKTDVDVASLQTAIGQYEQHLSDINAVIQTLRAEVGNRPASEQQSVWNCINALQTQGNAFDSALKALQEKYMMLILELRHSILLFPMLPTQFLQAGHHSPLENMQKVSKQNLKNINFSSSKK